MNIKIFCRCSLLPSWLGKGLISTPVVSFTPFNLTFHLQKLHTSVGIRPRRVHSAAISHCLLFSLRTPYFINQNGVTTGVTYYIAGIRGCL